MSEGEWVIQLIKIMLGAFFGILFLMFGWYILKDLDKIILLLSP